MKKRMPTIPAPMRRLFLLTCLAATTALPALPAFAVEKTAQAKLVVVLVVDGLPQEQVVRYRDQFAQGGFRRLLDQGAWFSDGHQAHGITVTAVGHSAVLTGAYPYQHGIVGNNWIDPVTLASVYCTEDKNHTYIGEETKGSDGTSPANLRVSTLGDELRYSNGERSKVVTVSGKDRGAILLAGKTGTAYMYMSKTGNFASSTYYMKSHPQWVQQYHAGKPQDRFYGKEWRPLLPDAAYSGDADDELVINQKEKEKRFPFVYTSKSGKPDADYYKDLYTGPYVDEMTLDFARAAIEGEKLGQNPAGVPDVLGVSLSSHDYVNHSFGPESRMSHDHLQRLDRMLANFFTYLDKRVGMDNTIVILTADHGFPNVPEFSQSIKRDAQRLDSKKMLADLNQHLTDKFGQKDLVRKWSAPNFLLDYKLIEQKNLRRDDVENAAARFLLDLPGVANSFTRTQFENGSLPRTRMGTLVQRAWHRQRSGDVMVVTKPYWYFGSEAHGTSHGSPYIYDTNVPLMLMGKPFKAGAYGQYAEVMDIAPTLAHLLRLRPPSGSEGRVLTEILR
ncbi:alkaline phosphatase family protein [Undibacterium pigrum]|uniref:Type I phosphodiesterase/nucleotide pyrophosphatase n=1 Tax=Undibacterium pigrum TaxID=401470 RepID=A0A318J8T1_9BURK|nr:alkaline phosphatase family protein [Undibacterium pigrum]PXX43161.1 type I phosphodiesterase/nucleotide pyrophosphatase [Undibacterium pigrum]